MPNDVKRIFSENPESDLWRELLQFTYDENIKRYQKQRGIEADDICINIIIGSFLQAYEYYKSAKDSNIQIAPLLLYYGSTNLLYGMTALLLGEHCEIKNHGMRIKINDIEKIAETQIIFSDPKQGGIHVFLRALGYNINLSEYGEWRLKEFLDSIAEISDDYAKCYDEGVDVGRIIMLDTFNTPEGNVEKVYYNDENESLILNKIQDVEGFENSYLIPTTGTAFESKKKYFILRHTINGQDVSEISYSGQPYLRSAHDKNGRKITLPTIVNMYVSLFVLGSLCRYYPEKWSPFVLKDNTGEKLLIEKFLFFARRIIPNIVLDNLLTRKNIYVSEKYKATETIKLVGEHQVREIIKKEVKSQLEHERLDRYR